MNTNLLTGNLKPIFLKYLFSAFGSAIIISIYSTVDLICIGHYCGPDGSAAISCITPLWNVMISLGLLLGIGGSVWLSNCRGSGKEQESNAYFTISLFTGILVSLLLLAVFSLFREQVLTLFGAKGDLVALSAQYARWIIWATPCFMLGSLLTAFVRNDGAPLLCTVSVITGGIVNIIGDIVFTFDFGLGMGISGAGLATALGQTVAILILCSHFFSRRCKLRLVRPQALAQKLGAICRAGFSPFVIDFCYGIMVILFNRQIMRYAGNAELAVFGTVATVALLFQSLFYAVGTALQPIASVNHGARQTARVRQVLRMSMVSAAALGLLFLALAELLPEQILRLYMEVDDAVLAVGPQIMRIYGLSFPLMGLNLVTAYYLQSILKSRPSLVISLLRCVIFSSAGLLLLPGLAGFSAIWWTMPLAEFLTLFFAVFFLRRESQQTVA